MNIYIDGPMKTKRTMNPGLTPETLIGFSDYDLDRSLRSYTSLVKTPEEWELIGVKNAYGYYEEGSTVLHTIKLVREITGLGLKEAKDLVETLLKDQQYRAGCGFHYKIVCRRCL